MQLYTAQYSYSGPDRLDITIKGKDPLGKHFAPTWKMVMLSTQGKISWEEYCFLYRTLMQKSYGSRKSFWDELLARSEVTLVCFCEPGSQCHRYLLAEYLTSLGATYQGERTLADTTIP